jgi:hypothetical protein
LWKKRPKCSPTAVFSNFICTHFSVQKDQFLVYFYTF